MVIRTCEQCGKDFEAQKVSARFCGAAHRVAWNRAKAKTDGATVVDLASHRPGSRSAGPAHASQTQPALPGVPGPQLPSRPAATLPDGDLSIETRVREELGTIADTALGQMCLIAARRIDTGDVTGSALASVLARLDILLEKALDQGAVALVEADDDNPITYLQRRAAEREAAHAAG